MGWPFVLTPFWIVVAFGISMAIGVIFGFYPARPNESDRRPALRVKGSRDRTETFHHLQDVLDTERFEEQRLGVDPARGIRAGGGDHGDGNAAQGRVAELLRAKRGAVHHGHHEIQEDQTGMRSGPQECQRLLTIGDTDGSVAFVAEEPAEHLADVGIVIDDQDEARHTGLWGRRMAHSA